MDNYPRCLPPNEQYNDQVEDITEESKDRVARYLGGFPTNSYKVFKKIDNDNDGYLSQVEFASKLKQKQFTDEECSALFGGSSGSKEYMTYDQFAKFLQ